MLAGLIGLTARYVRSPRLLGRTCSIPPGSVPDPPAQDVFGLRRALATGVLAHILG